MSDEKPDDDPMDDLPGPGFSRNDAHADLDPSSVLADTSVVIASGRDRNYTAESTPEWLETVVRTDDGRNYARNRGVEEASGEWIVIADDDITFPTTLTAILVDGMSTHHLIGLEDFWPMRWLLTRYMVLHRSLWDRVGGFDTSREHGGDTDFCIRCEKADARLCCLPRHLVPHHDVDSAFETAGHLEWLYYLTKRHPRPMLPRLGLLAARKLGLISGRQDV